MDLLECPICLFLMCEPVTMSCGHSFCRRCMGAFLPSRCPTCKERLKHRDAKNIKNNVLIFSIIEKCCPDETKMKCHIQEKLKTSEFTQALRIADEGIDMAPDDVSLKVWRAEACMGLRRFSDALRDLDDLCSVRPNWTEGFFRKGNVFLEMGRQTEALIQFYHCLKQQPDFAPAKNQIKKILEAEGMAVPEEVPRILHVVSEYLQDPITSSVSPLCTDKQHQNNISEGHSDSGQSAAKVKHGTGSECCLSLCQAVSFLPKAEDDEELMMKREDKQNRGVCSVGRAVCLSVLTVTDFECPLCIRLTYSTAYDPSMKVKKDIFTTSYQTTSFSQYFKNRKYQPTVLLQEIMSRLFPQQLVERKQLHDAEMAELSNLSKDIPIFVCTVAYPGIPCPLHIFEPRYRLMMRRCMETGTKKRGQRDGYHTADVEYLEDNKVDGAELESLRRLHDSVYQQAREWYHRLNSPIQEHISRQYGIMPEKDDDIQASANGPAWCWWLLSVLQLDPAYKTTVLSLTTLKDRLGQLRIVLEYFSQS
ncbi:hypothetical protein DNTS_015032 [Danionella cerebrum]|uniref:RING-type domain-containing protein n=1 Tax=Danionella cerebrum TaxID=2873325 RepID=A0A553QFV5_9TELE|nr:hypothetical protein DNTS_015032 [Danionella translucida]